eukprot:UN1739
MDEWIQATRRGIRKIAQTMAQLSNSFCRFAFLGYRDFDVEPEQRYSRLDFTSVNRFEEFLSRVHAKGGMDECEDLLGGLHESLGLSWKSPTRGLLLVTDAPCHGWQYHSPNALDDYPNVPPEFRAEVLFERMKDMNIFLECYKVGTINRHVVGMMRIFAQLWRSIHHIPLKVIDLQSHTNLLADSVSGSVSNSILSASEGAVVPINPNGSPDVMSRLARRGSLLEVDTGDSLEDADPQGTPKMAASAEGVFMHVACTIGESLARSSAHKRTLADWFFLIGLQRLYTCARV